MRNMRFDFTLAGRGFLLSKTGSLRGRAWQRESTPDTPLRLGSRTEENAEYGGLDPQLDYPEVWDDWSGGFGYSYRDSAHRNTYHWSQGFDARFPNQLVHCQEPQTLRGIAGASFTHSTAYTLLERVDEIIDASLINRSGPLGCGRIAFLGRGGWVIGYPTYSAASFPNPASQSIQIDQAAGLTASGTFVDDGSRNLHPAAIYGSYLWYGLAQASNGYFYGIPASGNLVTASVSGFRLAVAGNQLWKAGGPDPEHAVYLQNCGNPAGVATAANWGATYNIGNMSAPIRDLIGLGDQIFAATPIGLYAGDQTGTFVNVLAEIERQVHPDNCRDLAVFEGAVVVPHVAGVFAYRPATGLVEEISPPRADRSPAHGIVRAVRAYGRNLYAGLYDGSYSWLLGGMRTGQDVVWHTLQKFPGVAKVARLHVDGLTTASSGDRIANRFWAAMDASVDVGGTAPVYTWPIPSLDGNPLNGSPGFMPRYVGSARIDFGASDWGAPGTQKVYRSVEMVSENLVDPFLSLDDYTVDCYYETDGCGSRALLGTFFQSPKQTLHFPSGEGSFVTGQRIRLSLESFAHPYTGPATVCPIIKAVILRGALMPRYVDTITAVVRIGDEVPDHQGSKMRSGTAQLAELRALALSQQPHTLVDLAGASSYVKLLGPPEEQEVYPGTGKDDRAELAATIRMAVLTYTTNATAPIGGTLVFSGPVLY